jgi:hypothetical protein
MLKKTKGEQLQTPIYRDTTKIAEPPFYQADHLHLATLNHPPLEKNGKNAN